MFCKKREKQTFFFLQLLASGSDWEQISAPPPPNASVSPQGGTDPAMLHTLSYQPCWRGVWVSALVLHYMPGRRAMISPMGDKPQAPSLSHM